MLLTIQGTDNLFTQITVYGRKLCSMIVRVRRVLNRPVVFNGSHHRRKVKSLVLLLFQWNALSLCDELVARDLIGCNT